MSKTIMQVIALFLVVAILGTCVLGTSYAAEIKEEKGNTECESDTEAMEYRNPVQENLTEDTGKKEELSDITFTKPIVIKEAENTENEKTQEKAGENTKKQGENTEALRKDGTKNTDNESAEMDTKKGDIAATHKYILENVNPEYATVNKFEPVDGLFVKQTFADKDLIHEEKTIESLWQYETINGKEVYGRAFITMNSAMSLLYDVDEDSPYWVAFANPLVKDSNIETTDVVFAKMDLDGNVLSDCIYDNNTGLCYIPKVYNTEAVGEVVHEDGSKEAFSGMYFQTQVQFLQLVKSSKTKTTLDVEIESENTGNDINIEGEGKAAITDLATTISLGADTSILEGISDSDVMVLVDGMPYPEFELNREAMTLTIPVSSSAIDSIEVKIQGKTVMEKLFSKLKNVLNPVVEAAFFYNKPLAEYPLALKHTMNGSALDSMLKNGVMLKNANGLVGTCHWKYYENTGVSNNIDINYISSVSYMLGRMPSVQIIPGTNKILVDGVEYTNDQTGIGAPKPNDSYGLGASLSYSDWAQFYDIIIVGILG